MVTCSTTDLLNHPAVKSLPQFPVTYNEFVSFLKVTKIDLDNKKLALENERDKLKSSKGLAPRRIRNYISCQLFMLRKHAARLEGFESEVELRLKNLLAEDDSTSPGESVPTRNPETVETEISLAGLEINDEPVVELCAAPEIQIDEVDCGSKSKKFEKQDSGLDENPDSISCHSAESSSQSSSECDSVNYRISSGTDDSFDSSISSASSTSNGASPEKETTKTSSKTAVASSPIKRELSPKEMKLVQLLADMKKMKRRMKHVLDVTDRYCALRQIETMEPDGMTIALPEGSRSATPELRTPNGSALPDCISQDLMKATFQSFGNHLAVIAKTYTRRHSSDIEVAKEAKSPTLVSP